MSFPISLFWFRRDLRPDDNKGFSEALSCGYPVLPIFIFDTDILGNLQSVRDKRVNFIYQAVCELKKELEKSMSSLMVLYGSPAVIFERLTIEYDIKSVWANRDYEPAAVNRDDKVKTLLSNKGIEFNLFKDSVIFELSEVEKSDGTPYKIFTPYSVAWRRKLAEYKPDCFETRKYWHNLYKCDVFRMPGINEIGFETGSSLNIKPEINTDVIDNYHLTRNFPGMEGTTGMGVHLRFGTISIRKLVKIVSERSETLLNELIWREFFMMIISMFPYVENEAFKKRFNYIEWRNDEQEFDKWCNGETGYPLVDAGMRELNSTGQMHNRVRMVAASFLVKNLLTDWRIGEAYFAAKLMDYEMASNNGNWQWIAGCGCDSAPYFRIFNPVEQARKYDPENKYISRWVSEKEQKDTDHKIVDFRMSVNRALVTYKNFI
jgi:deoxyribodipyrimidine photo-lyase